MNKKTDSDDSTLKDIQAAYGTLLRAKQEDDHLESCLGFGSGMDGFPVRHFHQMFSQFQHASRTVRRATSAPPNVGPTAVSRVNAMYDK